MEIDWRNMKILFQDCLNKHINFIKARTSIYDKRQSVTPYKIFYVPLWKFIYLNNFACKFIDNFWKKNLLMSVINYFIPAITL